MAQVATVPAISQARPGQAENKPEGATRKWKLMCAASTTTSGGSRRIIILVRIFCSLSLSLSHTLPLPLAPREAALLRRTTSYLVLKPLSGTWAPTSFLVLAATCIYGKPAAAAAAEAEKQ